MDFHLAPRSDDASLAQRYRSSGRAHVPALLAAPEAHALRDALLASARWQLVFNRGDQLYEFDRATQDGLGAERRAALMAAIHREGREAFQYVYENIRVPDRPGASIGGSGEPALDAFAAFLNGDAFLAWARRTLGDDDIAYADCQATLFRSGHFLNEHDDDVRGKDRVAAYVFNLSPQWRPHWGGQLQFLGDDGHVAEAFVPTFNALNLLRVPQRHLVSAVTPLADPGVPRLSVTGWLRRRRP